MRWSGFMEFQGYKSDWYADTVFRIGTAYLVRENIQLDCSFTKNVKDTPALLLANVGMAWRFDNNYETNYKRVKQDKKKDKNKSKKRKDQVELEKTK
jgi:hypothetical protein